MHPTAPSSPPFARTVLVALAAAAGVAGTALAQTTLVANSPFAPSGVAAGSLAGPAQDFELAGSTSEGSSVTVCIYERQAKRSQWIPVGGITDGIRVVSYDAAHDQAVVVVGGVRKDIAMRRATFTGKGAPSAPANVAMSLPAPALVADDSARRTPDAPAAAGKPEQEQREARMLVSDLLEIGVQQRKAYQDARQKAAAGTPPAPSN